MKTDKEFAEELDAQDRIIARGYKMQACSLCNGSGALYMDKQDYGLTPQLCHRCGGKGHVWIAPVTK